MIAGAISFAFELAALILLKEKLGLDTLVATPIAFIAGVTVNYFMCTLWVFHGAKEQNRKRQAGFFLTSAVGLGINELVMLLLRLTWGEETVLFTFLSLSISLYMVNKVIATGVAMIWNYYTKKRLLQNKQGQDQKDENEKEIDK